MVEGINKTGIALSEIDFIVPTHIHLDHFGGGGHIMQVCENAKAIVHPKAARHVSNIDKWWSGSLDFLGEVAKLYDIPWVLDPVGAGASEFRSNNAKELLFLKPTVLRGNGSEIISISGISNSGKGVDSTSSSNEALDAAIKISNDNDIIVAITGEVDYVTNGSKVYAIHGGNEMMTKITATGCALTLSLIHI